MTPFERRLLKLMHKPLHGVISKRELTELQQRNAERASAARQPYASAVPPVEVALRCLEVPASLRK